MTLVKSADRVVQILELVSSDRGGYSHTEIADNLGIPKSSLSALLGNLVDRGYLNFDRLTKHYLLGPQLLHLAGKFLDGLDIVKTGQPFVKKLSSMTDESVALAIINGLEAIFVAKENSPQPIIRSLQIGSHLPIYATAAGKAMLAFWPDDEIRKYLGRTELIPFTRKTVHDPEVIWSELLTVRNGGLAYTREGYQEGITAIGAPVFDFQKRAVASLAVSAPSFRVNEEKKTLIETSLKEIAAAFSRQLGYRAS